MDSETADRFDRMPSDPDLGYEIKLVRTYIAGLTGDLIRNGRHMIQALSLLIRAAQVRLKQLAGQSALERFLREQADQVLAELEKRDE